MLSSEPTRRPRSEMSSRLRISAPSLTPYEHVVVERRVIGHFRPRTDSKTAKTTRKDVRSYGIRLVLAKTQTRAALLGFSCVVGLVAFLRACPLARLLANRQGSRHLQPVSFPPNQACMMRAKGGKCSAEGGRTGLRTRHAQPFT
jgi:hypothetical protein